MTTMGRLTSAELYLLKLQKLRRRLQSRDSFRIHMATDELRRRLEIAKRRTGDWRYPDGNPPGWTAEMGPRDTSIAERLRACKKRIAMWRESGVEPIPVVRSEQAEPPPARTDDGP